jgi:hypothetical protein
MSVVIRRIATAAIICAPPVVPFRLSELSVYSTTKASIAGKSKHCKIE